MPPGARIRIIRSTLGGSVGGYESWYEREIHALVLRRNVCFDGEDKDEVIGEVHEQRKRVCREAGEQSRPGRL